MITWTPEMIETLVAEFPFAYNRVLAKKLGISMRTLIRKARELNGLFRKAQGRNNSNGCRSSSTTPDERSTGMGSSKQRTHTI